MDLIKAFTSEQLKTEVPQQEEAVGYPKPLLKDVSPTV